ncbi:hypothetical protein INR49_032319 [Caranx melampygus]|nr:hypothetical protein INR49_032319 [Caranx melampygus]
MCRERNFKEWQTMTMKGEGDQFYPANILVSPLSVTVTALNGACKPQRLQRPRTIRLSSGCEESPRALQTDSDWSSSPLLLRRLRIFIPDLFQWIESARRLPDTNKLHGH